MILVKNIFLNLSYGLGDDHAKMKNSPQPFKRFVDCFLII